MAFKRRLKFDKRIKHKRKMNILYILIFVVLASFGVGYSYISTQLNVNGTANVNAASWDVHFANLNVTEGSITAETPANITSNTTVEFAATLENPGDFYEFSVDVVNNGTMDAMIDSFSLTPTLTTAQKKYLEYKVTYSDGIEIENKQELKAGATENLKVRFSYIENEDKTNYPTEDQLFNVSFGVTYAQADESSVQRKISGVIYRYTTDNVLIGESIVPTEGTRYKITNRYGNDVLPLSFVSLSQCEEAYNNINITDQEDYYCKGENGTYGGINSYTRDASTLNTNVYLKHVVDNNIVKESYVCFITDAEYCLRGGEIDGGEYEPADYSFYSPFYAENNAIFQSQNEWFVAHGGSCSSSTSCSINNGWVLQDDGEQIYADSHAYSCGVSMDGAACMPEDYLW